MAGMQPSSANEILDRLVELGPFRSESQARKALIATLEILGTQLFEEERQRMRAELPSEVSGLLSQQRPLDPCSLDEFFRRVARRERIRTSLGVEHAQITCRVISEALQPSTRKLLRRRLPELAAVFELPEQPETPPYEPHRLAGAPHDLAEGRAGGTHPLASSDTETLAHRHSVARSADPHAETRLSSARGMTQEREGRTLAKGRPGSRRPVSRSH